MLAGGLNQTQIAGHAIEYFNELALAKLKQKISIQEVLQYFQEVIDRRTSPNGVFGMKIHSHQFRNVFIHNDVVHPSAEWFIDQFSHFIVMSRRDKLSQAISLQIAHETRKWNSTEPHDLGSSSIEINAEKAIKITGCLKSLLDEDYFWRRVIKYKNLNCLDVCYEDLIKDYQFQMDRVFNFLGLPKVNVRPHTVKLGGEENQKARQWYLKNICSSEV